MDRHSRVARISGRRVLLYGTRDVYQVMRDAASLIERDLVCADIEATIDGSGIAADDLTTELLRQGDAERALTDGRWTQDRNEPRPSAHWIDSARTNASTTSTARSSIRPICWARFGRSMIRSQNSEFQIQESEFDRPAA